MGGLVTPAGFASKLNLVLYLSVVELLVSHLFQSPSTEEDEMSVGLSGASHWNTPYSTSVDSNSAPRKTLGKNWRKGVPMFWEIWDMRAIVAKLITVSIASSTSRGMCS